MKLPKSKSPIWLFLKKRKHPSVAPGITLIWTEFAEKVVDCFLFEGFLEQVEGGPNNTWWACWYQREHNI